MFTLIILCSFIPSVLFSAPVDDFLNPEKKKNENYFFSRYNF
ncbi:hypothetical protein LEP1GSC170_2376 [Leptospira interrogans serovar Bataviae str. HAI135]|nr:hypothetical protein LEP1GSC170_2376 [Leptospira interrogans serovar Bataviae str. HAI135]